MDVAAVKQYLETHKERVKLESQFKILEKLLTKARGDEETLSRKVNPESLITSKSIKFLNSVLSTHERLSINDFPVSFIALEYKNGSVRVSAVFSQPLFRGWHTETPYKSWQSCPLSLETPAPPNENHIPDYIFTHDCDYDFACWELGENGLTLHSNLDGRALKISWGEKS